MPFRLVFPGDLLTYPDEVQRLMMARQAELMELLGIQYLSLVKQDFEVKSRGGTGAGGIKWAELKASTLLRRLRRGKLVSGTLKTGSSGKIGKTSTQVRQALKALELDGAIKVTKDKKAYKKGGTFKVIDTTVRVRQHLLPHAASGGKTKSGKAKPPGGSYQIGVDTGLLRNSATPGFSGGDGKGGNILQVENARVTVGFGRSYAQYFDEDRKLIPDILPDPWRDILGGVMISWATQINKDASPP